MDNCFSTGYLLRNLASCSYKDQKIFTFEAHLGDNVSENITDKQHVLNNVLVTIPKGKVTDLIRSSLISLKNIKI